jgi:hypothetical protein
MPAKFTRPITWRTGNFVRIRALALIELGDAPTLSLQALVVPLKHQSNPC